MRRSVLSEKDLYDNIKMDSIKLEYENMNWIELTEDELH
jgi:hypothetical protein